jgi:hypothetical protein
LDATAKFIGVTGIAGNPDDALDGRLINSAQTYDTFRVTITTLPGGTTISIGLYVSTDDGQIYNLVAPVSLSTGSRTATASFGPTLFPAGALFCVGAVITAGGPFTGALSATVSKS